MKASGRFCTRPFVEFAHGPLLFYYIQYKPPPTQNSIKPQHFQLKNKASPCGTLLQNSKTSSTASIICTQTEAADFVLL